MVKKRNLVILSALIIILGIFITTIGINKTWTRKGFEERTTDINITSVSKKVASYTINNSNEEDNTKFSLKNNKLPVVKNYSIKKTDDDSNISSKSIIDTKVTSKIKIKVVPKKASEEKKLLTAVKKVKNDQICKIVLGDVNLDCQVDYRDVELVLKYSMGLITLNEKQLKIADINLDGDVNLVDGILIMRKYNITSPSLKLGDVNFDGIVNCEDAKLILRYSMQLEIPTEAQKEMADMNNDGKISVEDAILLMREYNLTCSGN